MQEAPTRLEVEELQENLRVVQELLGHEKPLARQYLVELRGRLDALHAADIAYVLEALPLEERLVVWDLVKADRDGEILLEVSDAVRETLIASMDSEELVAAAETLEADELADIAADLPASVIEEVVQSLPAEERERLRAALSYPEGSVGALMDFDHVAVRDDVTLEAVTRYLRRMDLLPDHTDQLFVVDREQALKGTLAIDDEQLIRMVRKKVHPAQVAGHRFQGDVVAHRYVVEIHQRADRALRIRQRRTQPLALLCRERLHHLLDDARGEIRGDVGKLIGLKGLGGSDQLFRVHARDERLAHRIRHFEQDLAVAVGLDQVPHHEPLLERQGFKNVGDVRRVQSVEPAAQLHQVLPRKRLLVPQELLHYAQVLLQLFDFEARWRFLHARSVSGDLRVSHPRVDRDDSFGQVRRGAAALVAPRAGQNRREPRRLVLGERRSRNAEVVAGRRFDAEHAAIAPFRDIQIQLEDAALGQRMLQHPRDGRLLGLADPGTPPRQEQVLCQLLADGRSSRDQLPALLVLRHRKLNRLPVEALVIQEPRILGDDHCALEMHRDAPVRDPLLLHLHGLAFHEGRRGRVVPVPIHDVAEEPQLDQQNARHERPHAVAEDLPRRHEAAQQARMPPR